MIFDAKKMLKTGLGLQLGLQMGLHFVQASTPLMEKIKAKTAKNGQNHPL